MFSKKQVKENNKSENEEMYQLLLKDNQKLFEENSKLMEENDVMFEELTVTRRENEKLRAVALNMLNSKSWRLTEPLRKSGDIISKIKKKASRVNANLKTKLDVDSENENAEIKEDDAFKRVSPIEFVEVLKEFDVISFDIFDTLIFRKLNNPTDVFQILGIQNKIDNFADKRIQAEKNARLNTNKKNFEINIYDIYEELEKYIKIDKEDFIKKEFELEKQVCYPNPYMLKVFNLLKAKNKKIIITTDMYWPKEYLEILLKQCGYEGYNQIYVSCEYEANKGNGLIQKLISKDYPKKNIVHIGDNYESDYLGCKKAKWSAFHYKSCQEIAEKLDGKYKQNSLLASLSFALQKNYLYNGNEHYSKYFKYGFKYGGLLVSGFMEYINNLAKEKNIDKILFLARDSKIFYDVYNLFYKEYDNEYITISRSAMFEVNFENNVDDFIKFYFQYRATNGKTTFEEALRETDLSLLINELGNYDLNASEYLTLDNYALLKQLIYDNADKIVKYFQSSKEAAIKYFKNITKKCKKILAVDLGWSGTIVSQLRSFLNNNINQNIEVYGAFIGNKDDKKVNALIDLGIFNPYVFSYNKGNKKINLDSWDGSMQAMFIESMFTSNEATLLKYEQNGFIYGDKTSNEKILNEIHNGILQFTKEFQEFRKLVNFIEINPTVASAPLLEIVKDYKYNYEIFKNFKEFQDSLPRFYSERKITTIGKIMKKRNFI